MDLRKFREFSPVLLATVVIACSAVAMLLTLAGKTANLGTEYRSIHSRLLEARRIAVAAGSGSRATRRLVSEQNLSLAIDELTRRGRAIGVNLLSITPKDPLILDKTSYKVLPIDIETRSTYEQLGTFLGGLDELERSIVTVENFTIVPQKEGSPLLEARLELRLFMEGNSA